MIKHKIQACAQCGDISGWHQQADLIGYKLFRAPTMCGENRGADCQGFSSRKGKGLEKTWQHEKVSLAHEARHILFGFGTMKDDLVAQRQFTLQTFIVSAGRAIPDDIKMPVFSTLLQEGERFEQVGHSFYVGRVEQTDAE